MLHLLLCSLFVSQVAGTPLYNDFMDQKAEAPLDEAIEIVSSPPTFNSGDVDSWFSNQFDFSLNGILKNIHPEGTVPGVVVAATSKYDPPYFFHWVRDSALTMEVVVELYKNATGETEKKYENLLWDYASLTRKHQAERGCQPIVRDVCEALGGPAEPKYEVDGSVYKGGWGRLQTDGPPLRASTFIRFAQAYLKKGGSLDRVKKDLYSSRLPASTPLKIDLEYAAHHWRDTTFDLWEEVPAQHFFTRMVTRRALLEGAEFANLVGDRGAADYYYRQVEAISREIDNHWDGRAGYIREMVNTPQWYNRAGKNVATILAVNHGYHFDDFYSPINEKILSTVYHLVKDFEEIYSINKIDRDSNNFQLSPAIEDVYDGTQGAPGQQTQGHPWYLATMAVAEHHYRAIEEFENRQAITVTRVSQPWFKSLGLSVQPGVYRPSSYEYEIILSAIGKAADSYVRRVMFHLNGSKNMAEQYNRYNGQPLSALNLTWSYASVLTTLHFRNKALRLA